MCGIVGVAAPSYMPHPMKEFFKELLFMDTIRGHHATGMAAIDTMTTALAVEKYAVPGPEFLKIKEVEDNIFAHKHNHNIWIGHNRWATSGAKDDSANAHPFVHGDIVGVHNGSLRNQRLLDDHEKFVVDSDNLYYHLNKNGLEDTIQKTNGAYALVWYNRAENSLNFLRNDERPLAIAKLTNGCYIWASEIGMLRWLVNRHKTLEFASIVSTDDNGTKTSVPHIYNLAKNSHVKIPYAEKARNPGEMVVTKVEPPVFPTQGYQGRQAWDDYDYYSGNRSGGSNAGNRHVRPAVMEDENIFAKFAQNAKVNSWVEVVFRGIQSEATKAGYTGHVAIYEFRSITGKIVKFHQFSHAQADVTKAVNDGLLKAGDKIFVKLRRASVHNPSTYELVKNDWLGYQISADYPTLQRPDRFFPYTDEGQEKQEGDNKNVVPFRAPQQEAATQNGKSGSEKSVTERSAEGKEDANSTSLGELYVLANSTTTKGRLLDYMSENHFRCSCCNEDLVKMVANRVYLHQHYDRAEGALHSYLSCSRRCHMEMEEITDMIDKDYNKYFGERNE